MLLPCIGVAQSGTVYNDLNGNGVKDVGEPGVYGITVKSFAQNETLLGTGFSNVDGQYTLSPSPLANQRIRVEFWMPSGSCYRPSTKGNVYGSSVRFVNGNKPNINFAVSNPAAVLAEDPILIHPRFVYGNQITGNNKDSCVLMGTRNSWGVNSSTSGAGSGYNSVWMPHQSYRIAYAKEIGSVYGVAYSKKRQKIYTSAFFRQFSGFGPNGPGAIYQIPFNYSTASRTAAPSLFKDVTTLTGQAMPADPHGTDITHNHNPTPESSDTRLAMVTKYSLGDMELNETETKLYVVNLYNREVIAINPDDGTLLARYPVPLSGLTNSQGATSGNDIRPFALAHKNGKLYVGAIGTGQSTQNINGTYAGAYGDPRTLHAYVWELNEITGVFTLVLQFSLQNHIDNWNVWQDSWVNGIRKIEPSSTYITLGQPILSDIEFYGNDIIVGFRNRLTDQWTIQNYDPVVNSETYTYNKGDILTAHYNLLTGQYEMETNGQVGNRIATGSPSSSGYNEFYRGEGTTLPYWNSYRENCSGSFVQINNGHLVTLQNFPCFSFNIVPPYETAGVVWLNNENGNAVKGINTYYADKINNPGGKINGMGAIEAVAPQMPIEVGNRVWKDVDGNGIQSADEDGIAGVAMQLLNASGTTILGNTTTDINGEYIFDETNLTQLLTPNTNYQIRINPTQFNGTGLATSPLSGLDLTPTATSLIGGAGLSDNDGTVTAEGYAVANITTPGAGESLHDIDFGMKFIALPAAPIANFHAWKVGQTTQLKFDVTNISEVNTIAVQRLSGSEWQTIHSINVNSNTNPSQQFVDGLAHLQNINLYRLKLTTIGAQTLYSETRLVRFNEKESNITVFPVPATNAASIRFATPLKKDATIRIVSHYGNFLHTQKAAANVQQVNIDINHIPAGTYNIIVFNEDTYKTIPLIKL
jgi:hypothetical protein